VLIYCPISDFLKNGKRNDFFKYLQVVTPFFCHQGLHFVKYIIPWTQEEFEDIKVDCSREDLFIFIIMKDQIVMKLKSACNVSKDNAPLSWKETCCLFIKLMIRYKKLRIYQGIFYTMAFL